MQKLQVCTTRFVVQTLILFILQRVAFGYLVFANHFIFLRLYEMGKCPIEETRQNSMVYYFTLTRTQYNV